MRINGEDKWTWRSVYMASPCSSATILQAELKEFNPGILLAASPHWLSPTVALLLLACKQEIPTSVFAFAPSRCLADYNMRPPLEGERKRNCEKDKDLSQMRTKGKQKASGEEKRVMLPEDGFNWTMGVEGLEEDAVMQGG